MQLSRLQATAIGLVAPLCWAMSVGLVREITTALGQTAGAALLCGIGALFLLIIYGRPRLGDYRPAYLVFGIGAAVLTEFFFVTSVATAANSRQTIEVGMVNYLWPCLTILAAVAINGQKARAYLPIGFVLCFAGIAVVLSGGEELNIVAITRNFTGNPSCYLMAFAGACCWAIYSALTRRMANGRNPVVIIFSLNALVFTLLYFLGVGERAVLSISSFGLAAFAAFVMASAYAAWTFGVMRGSITLLAIASYFTPVLSCLFSAWLLGEGLEPSFWSGVVLVVSGSVVCWLATR